MIEILKDILPKILGYLTPFAIRWYYKPEKIDSMIKIRVRGQGEGIVYDCGELAGARIWLEISNLSPFAIEVDRLYGQVMLGNKVGAFVYLRKVQLKPATEKEILIEMSFTEYQVQYIKQYKASQPSRVLLGGFVVSRVQSFELSRQIETNNVQFYAC